MYGVVERHVREHESVSLRSVDASVLYIGLEYAVIVVGLYEPMVDACDPKIKLVRVEGEEYRSAVIVMDDISK